jgi:hypothetical protein
MIPVELLIPDTFSISHIHNCMSDQAAWITIDTASGQRLSWTVLFCHVIK